MTDGQGNVNNILLVQDTQGVSPHSGEFDNQQKMSLVSSEEDNDPGGMLLKTEEPESQAANPVSEISVQVDDGLTASLPQMTPAPATKVSSTSNVSHDLPTPPLSEGGDDVQSKEPFAAPFKVTPPKIQDQGQTSKRSTDEGIPNMPSAISGRNR